MLTRVQKWGNSHGVRIPVKVLRQAKLTTGDEVDVTVEDGRIIVEPSPRVRGRYRLEELVAQMPDEYSPDEEPWGEPVGREVW